MTPSRAAGTGALPRGTHFYRCDRGGHAHRRRTKDARTPGHVVNGPFDNQHEYATPIVSPMSSRRLPAPFIQEPVRVQRSALVAAAASAPGARYTCV
jgi:hypothetical protein